MSRLNAVLVLSALAAAAMLALIASASAKPLEYDYCQELKAEQATLRNAGVEQNMRRGLDWAKANLTEDDLGRIRRYLTVEEQVFFRCGIKGKPKKQETQTAGKPPQRMPLPDRYRFRQPPGLDDAELADAPPTASLPRAEPANQVSSDAKSNQGSGQTATPPAQPANALGPGPEPTPGPRAALATTQPTTPAKPAPPAAAPTPAPGQNAALTATQREPAMPAPARKSDMLPPKPKQPAGTATQPQASASDQDVNPDDTGVEMRAEPRKTVQPARQTIQRQTPRPAKREQDWLSFE